MHGRDEIGPNQDRREDFELDLEMNDLLDEFGPEEEEAVELDIFADTTDRHTYVTNCGPPKKKAS